MTLEGSGLSSSCRRGSRMFIAICTCGLATTCSARRREHECFQVRAAHDGVGQVQRDGASQVLGVCVCAMVTRFGNIGRQLRQC